MWLWMNFSKNSTYSTFWDIVSQSGCQFTHTAYSQVVKKYVLPIKQISQKFMKVMAWECGNCVIWEWSEMLGAPCPPPGSNFRIPSLRPLILDESAHIFKFPSNLVKVSSGGEQHYSGWWDKQIGFPKSHKKHYDNIFAPYVCVVLSICTQGDLCGSE